MKVTYKIFTNILSKRLKVYADEIFGEYQCGFRQGRSTTDHIFSIRQCLEKSNEYNINLHQLFIDFTQAFDSMNRLMILKAMREFGIPSKLISLTKLTLTKTSNKVKIQNTLTESFVTENGVRQGDSLSTILLNIDLEKIMRNLDINPTQITELTFLCSFGGWKLNDKTKIIPTN